MSKYTSLIPPDVTIPEPPDPVRIVLAVVTLLVSLSLVTVIVFLIVEFLTDPEGRTPIQARRLPSAATDDDYPEENNSLPRKPLPSVDEILSQFHIVTPPSHARIEGRWITVICRWTPPKGSNEKDPPVIPPLYCNNLPVQWNMTFGNDVWFAHFEVEEVGEHHLTLLSQDLIVYVDDSEEGNFRHTEKKWKPLISHEGTNAPNRCTECHVMIEGKNDLVRKSRDLTIGPMRPSEACFACHQPETVKRRHSLLTELPGDDCASCHRLHGQSSERVGE